MRTSAPPSLALRLVPASVALTVLVIASCTLPPSGPDGRRATGGVQGAIYAKLDGHEHLKIVLPDIEVFLQGPTGTITAPVTTDLSGRFRIPPQPPGHYRLCWKGQGWLAACLPRIVTISDRTQYLSMLAIEPAPRRDPDGTPAGPIVGRVTLADGTPCRFTEPSLGLDQTAEVVAEGASGTKAVRANDNGDYVLADGPQADGRVRGTCGGGRAEARRAGSVPLDLVIPNSRPVVLGLIAREAGKAVRSVRAGASVDVNAEVVDADNDALSFTWFTPATSGSVVAGAANTSRWRLPAMAGSHTVYVVVSDAKGGLARGALTLAVGAEGVSFAGIVRGGDAPTVAGATVEVNGRPTTTDQNGRFTLTIPESRTDRYVVSIHKAGYVLQSRVYDHAVVGDRWRLTRAYEAVIDPARAVDVTDRGDAVTRKRSRGVRVQLDGNALVDSAGVVARGSTWLAVTTHDLLEEALPGNFRALDRQARPVGALAPFGAVFIEARDASGRRYQLARNATARITFPLDAANFANGAAPPDAVTLWHYDALTGFWNEAGVARRAGFAYVADAKNFGSLAVATPAAGSSPSPGVADRTACIRVRAGADTQGLRLRASFLVQAGAGIAGLFQFGLQEIPLDGPLNVVANLPAFTKIRLAALDSDGSVLPEVKVLWTPGVFPFNPGAGGPGVPPSGGALPFSNLRVPDNAPGSGAASASLVPVFPYAECGADVTLTFDIPKPSKPLHQFYGSGSACEGGVYYPGVDPQSLRTTLGAWKAVNGFGPNDQSVTATYVNNNELGLGRVVRCREAGGDLACFASNYGSPLEPFDALWAHAQGRDAVHSTVALEYRAIEGDPTQERRVKFFVFKGDTDAAPRDVQLQLMDYGGPRQEFVPRVCTMCHGNRPVPFAYPGSFPKSCEGGCTAPGCGASVFDVNFGASFRELDIATFFFPSAADRAAQAPAIAAINAMIGRAGTAPRIGTAPGIVDLITAWSAGNTQFIPTDWQVTAQTRDLYFKVVVPACRGCHLAIAESTIDWATWAHFVSGKQLDNMQNLVCGSNKHMPAAFVTSGTSGSAGTRACRPILPRSAMPAHPRGDRRSERVSSRKMRRGAPSPRARGARAARA